MLFTLSNACAMLFYAHSVWCPLETSDARNALTVATVFVAVHSDALSEYCTLRQCPLQVVLAEGCKFANLCC
eukprot:201845-Amphidinium_carterae.1